MNNSRTSFKIHPTAEVQTNNIGENSVIWQFAIILAGATIGSNCNINSHTFIENDVIIGNNVTIKSGVYLWDGIQVEDNVFIGPNATFVNDHLPRSKVYPDKFLKIIIRKGATIGANATIMGGITIGEYAMIGSGSVVTDSVPAHALVYGNPARIAGWVNESGRKLQQVDNYWISPEGDKFILEESGLKKIS